jgi:hypothetical protein
MTDAAPAPAPMPPPAPEAARTEIANLVRGADAAFATAYTTPSHPGHAAARARMDALHVAAYGEGDAGDQAQPAAADNSGTEGQRTSNGGNSGTEGPSDVAAYSGITLSTLGDVDPAEGVRAATEVRELAAALALPVDLARGGTQTIEQDIFRRGGRAMDQGELASFESALQRAAGAEYDAVCGSLEAAVKRAGPRGELLRRAIASASPNVAAWAVMSIHTSTGKGAVR